MENFISQTDLDGFYKNETKSHGKKGIQELIKQKRSERNGSKTSKTIFLSHSHLDKTIVNKISLLFNKLQTEIYVDWLDKTMPETTSKLTATTIKSKINECHHFLFLATYHGLRSKWCNWELGIADSIKSEDKLAILPIETKSGKWKGNEYLQLYPVMKFEKENLELLTVDDVKIIQLDGKIISLNNWLL